MSEFHVLQLKALNTQNIQLSNNGKLLIAILIIFQAWQIQIASNSIEIVTAKHCLGSQ